MSADPRLRAQIQLILDAHHDAPSHDEAVVFPPDWEEGGEVDYIYRRGVILASEPDVDRVITALNENFPPPPPDEGEPEAEARREPPVHAFRRVSAGVRLIFLPDYMPPVPDVLDRLDTVLGVGVATPDHLFYVCPYPCPATEPAPPPAGTVDPFPSPRSPSRDGCCHPGHGGPRPACDGDGVKVSILDTGLLRHAAEHHPWLAGVGGTPEDPYDPSTHDIRSYGGHGTFVAGCLRCMAPKAEIYVERAFGNSADAFETDLRPVLAAALLRSPDIIVFTFTTSCRLDIPPKTMDDFRDSIRDVKGLVVVVPAGNDGQQRWMWPAAYPWVVSVGALSASWRDRASFSNHGGWVDVYAPGEDLVNAYAEGTFITQEPPAGVHREFHGMAIWSGTSFSTPIVAGLIAARMSATGENGQQAADSLLELARSQAIAGVGAALYPGQACCQPGPACQASCSPR